MLIVNLSTGKSMNSVLGCGGGVWDTFCSIPYYAPSYEMTRALKIIKIDEKMTQLFVIVIRENLAKHNFFGWLGHVPLCFPLDPSMSYKPLK